jgi:hypothetical protein
MAQLVCMNNPNKYISGCECRLCGSTDPALFFKGGKASGFRNFLRCPICDLVFVPEEFFSDRDSEESQYLLHNNDVNDPDYRAFLGRLYYELKPHLAYGAKGLDYGAGPGPALVGMMRDDGFEVRIYDPFFHPDTGVLDESYDFITCTETVEHFRQPSFEFKRLDAMIRQGGWLGVMTSMLDDWSAFPAWHYHRDPTHICFYSRTTMRWIAGEYSWEVAFPRQNVTLFRKTTSRQTRGKMSLE